MRRVYNTIFIASAIILFSLSGITIISSEIPTASGQTYIIQANNDIATTYQGLPSTIDVLLNDYDPNPSAITNVVIDSQPLHGSVTYNPNTQLVTYTSSQDYYGSDFFTYHVDDGISISNIAQVSITVIQVIVPNSPPVAVLDTYTTNEETPIVLNVLANDYDPDGDPLTIVSVTGPSHGTISIRQDQTIKYTPKEDYSGQDSFSYTISDGHPHGVITTEKTNVNITIMPVNHPPVAETDFVTTNENTPIKISVLSNDYDPDGNKISIISVSTPSHGTTVINADQTITYTPSLNYVGSDSFTYVISDNHGSTVTVTGFVNVIVHGLPSPIITNPSSDLFSNNVLQTISGTSYPNVIINLYDGTLLIGTTLADSSGKWSIQTSLLSDGLHVITTKATDSTGTLSPASNAINITIDTINPTITISSPSDGATISTSSFTVSGIASDANLYQVNISIDSGLFKPVTGTSSWSTIISGLSNGPHTITASATDNAGNIQTSSIMVIVDLTSIPPTISITSPANGAIINTATPLITGTASAGPSGLASVQIQIDSGAFNDASGTTSWTFNTASLADGVHTITAKATDNLGNTQTTSITITVDTTAPAVTITSPANGAIINTATPLITGTASAGPSGLASVQIQIDSGAFNDASGTTSWTFNTASLADGVHTITAKATDNVGNTQTTSITITVDTTAPTISITSPANGAIIGTKIIHVTGTASDATSGLANVQVKIDSNSYTTASGTTSWTFNTASLADGVHTITAKATDNVGNTQISTIAITVDTTAPTISITSPANGAIINTATPLITGTASDATSGLANVQVKIDSGAFNDASDTTSWTFNTASLADGVHTITAKATDNAGNIQTTSITITVDTTAPAVTITSPANGAIIGTKIIHVTGTASDATSGLANVQVKIDSNSYTTASGTTSWTFNTASLADGVHTINAKATDNAGNTRTTSITVIVQTNTSGKITAESGSIGGTTNFEFEIQSSNGHTHGNFRYVDKLNKVDLQSISIISLSIDHSNTKASFSGTAKVNGHSGYRFNVYVEDNGYGKNDFFSIKILDSTGHKIYEKSNKLTQGNIKIHK